MNHADIIIAVAALIFGLLGYFKGFVIGIIELIGLAAAYFGASYAYKADLGFLNQWLSQYEAMRKVLESVAVFYAILILFMIIKKIVHSQIYKNKKLKFTDRSAGFLLGIVKCSLFTFLFSVAYLLIPASRIPENFSNTVKDSVVLSFFDDIRPAFVDEYLSGIQEKVKKIEKLGEASKDPKKAEKLQKDPAVQEFLKSDTIQALQNDPDIQEAVKNKDFSSLLSNPKVHALMKDKDVQKMLQDIDIDKILDEQQ